MTVNPRVPLAPTRRSITGLRPPRALVWVLRAGWHTGLVLPKATTGHNLLSLLSLSPEPDYLVFGWGDRDFYMAAHPGIWTALSALFPSPSVLLVQSCRRKPTVCLGPSIHLRPVRIDQHGIARLRQYLEQTLKKNSAGHLEPIAHGPVPQSEFFASKLSYDAFHTCNTWTADALRRAGVPVTSNSVLFAFQLWEQLPQHKDQPSIRRSMPGSDPDTHSGSGAASPDTSAGARASRRTGDAPSARGWIRGF